MEAKEYQNFIERVYWKELERRDKIYSQLTLPVTLVTILSGVVAYYWKILIPSSKWDPASIILGICCLCSSITVIASIILLSRVLKKSDYANLPYTEDIHKYLSDTVKYYAANKSPTASWDDTDRDINVFFYKAFMDASTMNARNNDKKSALLYWAHQINVASVIIIIIGFLPYLSVSQKNVMKTEVINLKQGEQVYATRENQQPKSTTIADTTTTSTAKETTTSPAKDIKGRTNTQKTKKIKNQ
ncbi:MAG: hypothetical protein WC980_04605 [Candidatus Brocadiia bacterium]